ncbi:MAG: glycosyltransferase [Candidatus Methanomethylophilaceae archaeon]|jgi:UDP-N-acetylglucosamine transferase subunit ALG13
MILVIVGTLGYPFDRLLRKMDEITPELGEEVVMQLGISEYEPKNTKSFHFESEETLNDLYDRCSLLVCHAGAGTILNGLIRGKSIVLVPRRAEEKEVTNDHQLLLVDKMEKQGKAIGVTDVNGLKEAIFKARGFSSGPAVVDHKLVNYLSDVLLEYSKKC